MRLRALVPFIGFIATVAAAASTVPVTPTQPVPRDYPALRLRRTRQTSLQSNVDAQVLANLFAAEPRSDFDVAVSSGTISCEARTCRVAFTVRVPETTAPLRLSFAVASPKGELSEIRHAECLTALCTVQLVLERGRNVVAVGAADAMSRGTGFATTQINVDAPMTARKAEWF